MKTFFSNHKITFILLLLLSIPLTIQIFTPGFFVGDDGEWMIIRSSAFHEALRDGQIPVRNMGRLNHEYGYPAATFLYPGYLYLTEPLIFAHLGFVNAIKIMFTVTMVVSGIFAYLWLAALFKKWPAFIGAIVYLYTPYHLVDMYNRGSLGELLALAVIPFILWNIERESLFFSALGIGTLILSHNIMAALFLPVIFLYAIFRKKETIKKRVSSIGLSILLGIGLAAFFWIPALFELHYTVFNQTKISDWQNFFAPYPVVGVISLAILSGAIYLSITKRKLEHRGLFIFFTVAGTLSVFLSSSSSAFLWNVLPVTFIQFPFRFLSVEIVAVAFLSAALLQTIKKKYLQIIYYVIILIAMGMTIQVYLNHMNPSNKGEGFYTTNESTTTTRDEYMPIWVKVKPLERPEKKIQAIKGAAEISTSVVNNKKILFTANVKSDAIIEINKIYWPGWVAKIDNSPTTISYTNPKGLMTIPVTKGHHSIAITFQETPLRLTADSITAASLIGLLGFIFFQKRKAHKK
jgi:hypothetical protein